MVTRKLDLRELQEKAVVSQPLTRQAAALRDEEDYDHAIPLLEQAVAEGEPDALRLLALSLFESDRAAEAERILSQAVVEEKKHDLASLLGDIADDLGHAELAEDAYRIAIDHGEVSALNDYGCFLRNQERHQEAIAAFNRAIDSGDELAGGNLVLVYSEDLEDLEKAQELGERYLSPSQPKTYTALADVYERLGRLDDAELLYVRAVDLKAPRAHLYFGWFLRDFRENLVAAEAEFRRAREEDEAGWGADLGSLLLATGRQEEAVEVLRRAAEWGDVEAGNLLIEINK